MNDRDGPPPTEDPDGTASEEGEPKHHPMFDGPYDQESRPSGDGADPVSAETEENSGSGILVEALGNLGILLGMVALSLAVVGLLLGAVGVQPVAKISLFVSLLLVTVSMILGTVFQAFGTDRPLLTSGK